MTILVKMFFLAYVANLIRGMVLFENADLSENIEINLKHDADQTIRLTDTKINPIIIIKDVVTNEFHEYDENMHKYLIVEMG